MAESEASWRKFLSDINFDLFDQGIKQLDNGQLAEAAETFNRIVRRKTLSFCPYFFLAGIYSQLGQYKETVLTCENALYFSDRMKFKRLGVSSAKNPIYSQFLYTLGTACLNLNRYMDAVDCFEQVIESHNYKKTNSSIIKKFYPTSRLSPSAFYALVHYNLGIAYSSLGDQKEALQQYQKLKKLDKEKAEKLKNIIGE
jgi:tetratricopeptide (TPR) repeat protein